MRLRFPGRRTPFVPQMESSECGAACLAMILAHHGRHVPLMELRRACAVGRDGTSAEGLRRAAMAQGLDAAVVQVALEHLRDLPLPAILHWDFNHFVVLERLTRKGALLIDPATGRRRAGPGELDASFTGVALAFSPEEGFQLRAPERPSLGRFREQLREALPVLVQAAGYSLLLLVLGLVPAMASQFLLDQVVIPRREAWLTGLACVLGGTMIARTLASGVRSGILQNLQVQLDLRLMHRFVEHLLALPVAFFLQRRPGDLMQRSASLTEVRVFLAGQTATAFLDSFQILAFGAIMLAWQPLLGTLVLGLTLARVLLRTGLRRFFRQLMAAELAEQGREQAVLMESLSALETLKASQSEDRMVERWTRRMAARVNLSLRRRRLELWTQAGMGLFQAASVALITWVGGQAVLGEGMTLGVYAAFLVLQGMIAAPLESLLSAYDKYQYLATHLSRLDDVLENPPEPQGGADPGRLEGRIELRDLSFRYQEGGPWALEGISLGIRPGEKVAIAGPTGSGKSTLASLLLGLHEPQRGRIHFDGRPLESLDRTLLRRQMGVVLQNTFLFNASVRENLLLHAPDLGLEALREVARQACILDVIEALPQGFETPVGENGCRLSGGQRQRLSLARALAHDPSILLLDEATSNLDRATEAALHANLAQRRCTRIVIAHRLDTVRDADRILVLEGGRLAQEGSFEELAAREGLFRNMLLAMEAAHG